MKKERITSIELLRIICILAVLAHHWELCGNEHSIIFSQLTTNQVISFIFGSWGALAVNCFFAISSYFLLKKKEVSMNRLISLAIKVSIFGVVTQVIGYLINAAQVNYIELVKSIMGIFSYQYWFITVYIIMCLLSPCLNSIVHQLPRLYHLIVLFILVYFTYIWKFIDYDNDMVARMSCGITIYLIVGYLEKYNIFNYFSHRLCLCVGGVMMALIVVAECAMSFLGNKYTMSFCKVIVRLQTIYSPILLFTAILIFYGFLKLNIKQSRLVNFLGKYSSGGYLIHGGAFFVPVWLYDGLFKAGTHYHETPIEYLLSYVFFMFSVFTAGVISDLFYDKTINSRIESLCARTRIGKIKLSLDKG